MIFRLIALPIAAAAFDLMLPGLINGFGNWLLLLAFVTLAGSGFYLATGRSLLLLPFRMNLARNSLAVYRGLAAGALLRCCSSPPPRDRDHLPLRRDDARPHDRLAPSAPPPLPPTPPCPKHTHDAPLVPGRVLPEAAVLRLRAPAPSSDAHSLALFVLLELFLLFAGTTLGSQVAAGSTARAAGTSPASSRPS